MAETMQDLVDHLLELWNSGDTEAAGRLYSPDAERFDPNGAEPLRGPEAIGLYVSRGA